MNIHPFLYTMTLAQLYRVYNRLYDRMLYGPIMVSEMEYQPYGYDNHTLWMNDPSLYHAVMMVRSVIMEKEKEKFLLDNPEIP